MSAALLSLMDIDLTFGGPTLLEGASLDVAPGARIALVGRNGSGKSTLMKIAAGLTEPDRGTRFVHPGARVYYLPQKPDFSGFETAIDYVSAALVDPQNTHLAEKLLAAVGVNGAAALATASGGEGKRIAITAAFAFEPDVFLLDEPTNHLDIAAIEWLEDRLATSRAALVIISHDRRFLEKLTNETLWIDRGRTRHLDRGFAAFEAWRDDVLDEEAAQAHKLERKIAAEEDWVRYGVTARRKRNVRRLGELQAMRRDFREARAAPGAVAFTASKAEKSGKRAIVAEHISKSYGNRKIVDDFSIEIARGEKIGIVAPNGEGKTTLLNMLTGALAPDEGSVTLGAGLQLITLDQRRASLKPELRLADAISDERGDWVTIGGHKKHVATYLQDFLFAPEQWRAPVSSLSGGELGRLALAAALAKPSNLLALDEPTNDLDLETLDLLEDLLADYSGTLLLISHDRSFLDRIVTSIVTTDPEREGRWRRYPGGYDDMLAQRGSAPSARDAEPTPARRKPANAPAPKTRAAKLSYKEQYALETLPKTIAALETQAAELSAALGDHTLFAKDAEAFNKKARALDDVKATLEAAEEEWLALEIKREEVEKTKL